MAPKLTRDAELIRTARAVLSLQRKISKYRRQIKAAQVLLKHERKILRGLAYAAENRPDVMPNRLDGGASGFVRPRADPKTCAVCGRALRDHIDADHTPVPETPDRQYGQLL